MKILMSWLRDYIDIQETPERIADALLMVGIEVEAISQPGKSIHNVVIGKILSRDRHPNADKLSVCQVTTGTGDPLTIVCGAPNCDAGAVVPVAVIGAMLALSLSISSLSLFTLLGLIMLLGLVAKNAILIVDRTNQLKAEGMHYVEALVEAGRTRLRPILMTTIAMVFGMLPIALATGTGSEWKNGLAWVLIGGLTSSMLLTIFLVPVMYHLLESARLKVSGWMTGRSAASTPNTLP